MRVDSELISIIALMDDPDSSVREAVVDRLMARGEESLDTLARYIGEEIRGELAHEHMSVINEVRERIIFNRLTIFLNSKDHTLSDGLMLVTKYIDPSMDEQLFYTRISELSEDIVQELSDEKTDLENIGIFNYFFFKRIGFIYTDYMVEKEEGTIIDRVLVSRQGNPVAISIIYFLLARAVGMEIHPLCFPGGFVPVLTSENGRIVFYLNIFKGGAIFLKENLIDFFKEIGIDYDPDNVRIEDDIALVSIYAELLGYLYRREENGEGFRRVEQILSLMGDRRFL